MDYFYGRFSTASPTRDGGADGNRHGNNLHGAMFILHVSRPEVRGNFCAWAVQRVSGRRGGSHSLEEPESGSRVRYSEVQTRVQTITGEAWQTAPQFRRCPMRSSKLNLFSTAAHLSSVRISAGLQYRTGSRVEVLWPTHSLLITPNVGIVNARSQPSAVNGCDGSRPGPGPATSREPTVFAAKSAPDF